MQKAAKPEEFSNDTNILEQKFHLKEHGVTMRFVQENDAVSIEPILTAAGAKWAGMEAKNSIAIRESIHKSRQEADKNKTVLDLTILNSRDKIIGRCGIHRDKVRTNEFNLSMVIKPDEGSLKLSKDIVTTLVEWAKVHLAHHGFSLVYQVGEGAEKSEALAEKKDLREVRTRTDESGKQVTDYLVRLQ